MKTFNYRGVAFTVAPQTAQILRHLKTVGDISGVEAAAIYKARSTTKRIAEINDALCKAIAQADAETNFYPVKGEFAKDATGQRYKRYVMPDALRASIVEGAAQFQMVA